MTTKLGDVFSITTFDGKRQFFPQGLMTMPAYGGFGAPPITWVTARGYRQHGATVLDHVIGPRSIVLELYYAGTKHCTREDYWRARAELLDLLRPNRGGPLRVTLTTAAGTQRMLLVEPDPGLVLPPTDPGVNDWSVREAVSFTAFDPFWYDPTPVTQTRPARLDTNLVFPITFPIEFGLFGGRFVFDMQYKGTWESYPTFVVSGPYNNATFINGATGARFQLVLPIGAGEQRIINLDPLRRRITNAAGENKFGELSPTVENSNLNRFSLQPYPTAPNGVQSITVILSGISDASGVSLRYYERYWGI